MGNCGLGARFVNLLRLAASAAGATAMFGAGVLAQVPAPATPASPPAPRPYELISLDPAFDRLVAPGTQLETVVTIPGLNSEGPLWRGGKLWISDQKNSLLYEVGLDGAYRVLVKDAGGAVNPAYTVNQGPNGSASYMDGSVLFARQGYRDIGRIDRDGKVSAFLTGFEGKRFNSPNDLTVRADGTIFFTDPPFSLPGYPWREATGGPPLPPNKEIPFNGVFRFKDGRLTPVITDMRMPNGVALSPDGRTLYVNNYYPDLYTRAYSVDAEGGLSNGRELIRFPNDTPFGRGSPDGLKVDSLGNVWTTGPGGVLVVSPEGKLLGRFQLPATATNLAFGGDDYRSVFFTCGATVYRVRTLVSGAVPPFAER